MTAKSDRAQPDEPPVFSTTALGVAILVVAVVIGSVIFGPPGGIVLGPSTDLILTPRLMRALGRRYVTPGAALWSVVFAAVALLPIYALPSAATDSHRQGLLVQALGFAGPGLLVGLFALRGAGHTRRLALIGSGASLAVGALATAVYTSN